MISYISHRNAYNNIDVIGAFASPLTKTPFTSICKKEFFYVGNYYICNIRYFDEYAGHI